MSNHLRGSSCTFAGFTKPDCQGHQGPEEQGNGLFTDALHQGLLPHQFDLPMAHQQSKSQVQLDSSATQWPVYPRFAYVRTDSEGKASYTFTRTGNGQNKNYYLHYYDEGLFYNGFWVVNDLETGYVETEGRVFIYNSENDDCPQVPKRLKLQ